MKKLITNYCNNNKLELKDIENIKGKVFNKSYQKNCFSIVYNILNNNFKDYIENHSLYLAIPINCDETGNGISLEYEDLLLANNFVQFKSSLEENLKIEKYSENSNKKDNDLISMVFFEIPLDQFKSLGDMVFKMHIFRYLYESKQKYNWRDSIEEFKKDTSKDFTEILYKYIFSNKIMYSWSSSCCHGGSFDYIFNDDRKIDYSVIKSEIQNITEETSNYSVNSKIYKYLEKYK